MDIFLKDMRDTKILKQIIENKNYLLSNNIVSTPAFIANEKVLNHNYSLYVLEEVINNELKME